MEPFKNLLGLSAATQIAKAIARADPKFSSKSFLSDIESELSPLELKDRMRLLVRRLEKTLPQDPQHSFPLLIKALKQNESDSIGLSGFLVWPLTQYVADHGINHFDLSMKALYEMTKVFTSEFAIRAFLIRHEQKTLKTLETWVHDQSEHVRRLVSEGSRPLLPWGERLPRVVQNPQLTWSLLEQLKNDRSEYVRKSVANHINDHSKCNADWVIEQLKKWEKPNAKVEWVIRHATRSLIKKAHPGALALHGISGASISVLSAKILTPTVLMGKKLEVQLKVKNSSNKPTPVLVDHKLFLLGANGAYREKVFKGRKLVLQAKQTEVLKLQLKIKPVTTRKYYAGTQKWCALVNGRTTKSVTFTLKC